MSEKPHFSRQHYVLYDICRHNYETLPMGLDACMQRECTLPLRMLHEVSVTGCLVNTEPCANLSYCLQSVCNSTE